VLRIAPGRRVWIPNSSARSSSVSIRAAGSVTSRARVEVVRIGGESGTYAVRVRVQNAHRVEVMGDFTEWKPVDLVPGEWGSWQLVTRLTPGVRQLTVRIDGERWTVPAGASVEQDEYGQPVGVVIVP